MASIARALGSIWISLLLLVRVRHGQEASQTGRRDEGVQKETKVNPPSHARAAKSRLHWTMLWMEPKTDSRARGSLAGD
jgi:hypothetical protein